MVPISVKDWMRDNDYGAVLSTRLVGGGCINNGMIVKTTSGESFFLKTNTYNPPDMFVREAEGLQALRVDDGPRVPKPFLYGPDFLLLEDLSPAPRQQDYWVVFGRQLAALHNHAGDRFGFSHDNYIGSTPQPNPWTGDGHAFFGEHRLLFQAYMAQRRGLLGKTEIKGIERLVSRLAEIIPAQPASLTHGDLWTGNAMTDSVGAPAIIDPAAHYGWAEADLAMTTLFGAFSEAFYRTYQEVRPLEKGFRERFDLYNLYHLLNHLNLFGTGYLGQVISVLRRYS